MTPTPTPTRPVPTPYRLEGTDRVELLVPLQARARNSARTDKKLWMPDPRLESYKSAKAPRPIPTGDARKKLELLGGKKDAALWAHHKAALRLAATRTDEGPCKIDSTSQLFRLNKATKTKATPAKGGTPRTTWEGLGMCQFLRVLGVMKVSKDAAPKLCTKAGFKPGATTIHIQMKAGFQGGEPAATPEMKLKIAAL